MSSSTPRNYLSNNIDASFMWIGWHVLRPNKSLVIPMHDWSRKSSLWWSLKFGRRCVNLTALKVLFMTNPSIKHPSWRTVPPSNFTLTTASQCLNGTTLHDAYYHHTKAKRSQSYEYSSQGPILTRTPE